MGLSSHDAGKRYKAEGLPDQGRYPAEGLCGGYEAEYRGGPELPFMQAKKLIAPENQFVSMGIIYTQMFCTLWWKSILFY